MPSEGPRFSFEIERAKVREFVQALGQLDPIHCDVGAARRAGYRDLVAPIGFVIWTLGQDGTEIFRRFGLAYDRGLAGSEGWDFLGPICAGDVLTGQTRYRTSEVREGSAGPMTVHYFDTEYDNQLGGRVLEEHSSVIQWERSPYEVVR
jgi:acyl dehydratase